MSPRFTVLGSGSSGNASLLQTSDFGLLIDVGLGPRQMAARLRRIGSDWSDVGAVVLTHTHGDHWRDQTLEVLLRRQIPFYCHPDHLVELRRRSSVFRDLAQAGLLRYYRVESPLNLPDGLQLSAFPLSHDSGPTFGFRIAREPSLFSGSWAMAYACDLGTWTAELVPLLADVDLLALEFNHDVPLQQASGRPNYLIQRVLGDWGHLSNEQAAALLKSVLQVSRPGRLQHVVQLHLSRQCNRPHLALQAARDALADIAQRVSVLTADQQIPLCIDPLPA